MINNELIFGMYGFGIGVIVGFVLYAGILFYTSPSGIPKYLNPPAPPRKIKVNNMPSVISKESLILSNENHKKAQKAIEKLKNVAKPEFPKNRKG